MDFEEDKVRRKSVGRYPCGPPANSAQMFGAGAGATPPTASTNGPLAHLDGVFPKSLRAPGHGKG